MTQGSDDGRGVDDGGAVDAAQRRQHVGEHVRSVRVGHGANCSSIGSVVDTLFATATIGAAVFAAVVAALSTEPVRTAAVRERRPEGQAGKPPP